MEKRILSLLRTWKIVFFNWKYSLLALLVAFIFYSINIFIMNYKGVISFGSNFGFFKAIPFFFTLVFGFGPSISPIHPTFIITSILLGFLISLVAYKTVLLKNGVKGRYGFFTLIGIFLGILAPGCAACGIGLASTIGLLAAFSTLLPFHGLIISIIAIFIIAFVVLKISIKMEKPCQINYQKMKGGTKT